MTTFKRIRLLAGKTLQQIADEVGCSRQVVWEWEQGSKFPGVTKLHAAAKAYGKTVAQLIGIIERERAKKKESQQTALAAA